MTHSGTDVLGFTSEGKVTTEKNVDGDRLAIWSQEVTNCPHSRPPITLLKGCLRLEGYSNQRKHRAGDEGCVPLQASFPIVLHTSACSPSLFLGSNLAPFLG